MKDGRAFLHCLDEEKIIINRQNENRDWNFSIIYLFMIIIHIHFCNSTVHFHIRFSTLQFRDEIYSYHFEDRCISKSILYRKIQKALNIIICKMIIIPYWTYSMVLFGDNRFLSIPTALLMYISMQNILADRKCVHIVFRTRCFLLSFVLLSTVSLIFKELSETFGTFTM